MANDTQHAKPMGSSAAIPPHPNPDGFRHEIIRLKALMPQAGCRTIAHHFNRRIEWAAHGALPVVYQPA